MRDLKIEIYSKKMYSHDQSQKKSVFANKVIEHTGFW